VSDVGPVATFFKQRLGQLRTEQGLSQEEVARRAGVHRTVIHTLEKGEHHPRLDTVVKLAAAFEVDPCDLIRGVPRWRLPSGDPGGFENGD
jgi:transcriptional regulator with XRE-family HTH domain